MTAPAAATDRGLASISAGPGSDKRQRIAAVAFLIVVGVALLIAGVKFAIVAMTVIGAGGFGLNVFKLWKGL